MYELTIQDPNKKECKEVDANDESEEKLKEMEEEFLLLNKNVEQLSKENNSVMKETMKKEQIDEKVKINQELKEEFKIVQMEGDEKSAALLIEIKSCNSEQRAALHQVVKCWASRGEENKLKNLTENDAIEARHILGDGTKSHTSSLNKVEVREVANEISTLDSGSGNNISVPPEELHTSSLDYCLNKDEKICEETCIEESNIDEPEAADLAANDDTEDDTATAPPDDCLDLEAADLSEVHRGAEGSDTTSSALPAYC